MSREPRAASCEILSMTDDSIIRPGKNAWRTERASRVKFLIDGAAYYDAFVAAVERAEQRVILVGWDIDSRTRLNRPGAQSEHDAEQHPPRHDLRHRNHRRSSGKRARRIIAR